MAALAAVAAGAAFLIPWELTRERLPAGAIVVPRDAATLSDALEAVVEGGTIALDARWGPFLGGVSVSVPGVVLRSIGGGAVLRADSGVTLTVVADGVSVDGLAFDGGEVGILVQGSDCRVARGRFESLSVGVRVAAGTGSVVEGCTFRDAGVGVEVLAPGNAVQGARFQRLAEAAVRVRNASACLLARLDLDACVLGVVIENSDGVRLDEARARDGDTGIRITGGAGAAIEGCAVAGSRVGIELRQTKGASIAACDFRDSAEAGILLDGAERTLVVATDFRACREGVHASRGQENAVCDSTFSSCGVAIAIDGEADDLIARDSARGGLVGVSLRDASRAQILRAAVRAAEGAGVVIDRCESVQVLDAQLAGCPAGVVVARSSDVTVRRCEVEDAVNAGIALLNGISGNTAAENRVSGAGLGVFLAGSSRASALENSIVHCRAGVALCRLGYGARVEGNSLVDCDVGIAWSDVRWAEDAWIADRGWAIERPASATAPLVLDNALRGSRVGVRNETEIPLLLAANGLSGGPGPLEGNVHLPAADRAKALGIGTERSTSALVLGRLLQWMLVEEGVLVVDLIGLGSERELVAARARGDLDIAWCDEDTAEAALWTFWDSSLDDAWSIVARPELARRAAGSPVSVSVALPGGAPAESVAQSLRNGGYEVRSIQVVETTAAAESLLKFGSVDCAVVARFEETLTLGGFVPLAGLEALPSRAIGLCVSAEVSGAALRSAFGRLVAHLSDAALRDLVSRVRLLGRDPSDVAMEYLLREGLIGQS